MGNTTAHAAFLMRPKGLRASSRNGVGRFEQGRMINPFGAIDT
jgi:hypothetical protein